MSLPADLMTSYAHAGGTARTITCLGLDWRSEVSLKSVLGLLQGLTTDSWRYVDEAAADVMVCNRRNPLAEAVIRRAQALHTGQVIFSTDTTDREFQTIKPPFGSSHLIECLNLASQKLLGVRREPDPVQSPLAAQLDAALNDPGVEIIQLQQGRQQGYLMVASRTLHWPTPLTPEEIAAWLSEPVTVQALTRHQADLLKASPNGLPPGYAAEGLLWSVGMTRSDGRLFTRLNPDYGYQLERLPDFGDIEPRPKDLQSLALLQRQSLSLPHLAHQTRMPMAVIHTLINACALCGILRLDAAAGLSPTSTTARLGQIDRGPGLFSQWLKRLHPGTTQA